jgi:hypothetical protein
MIKSMPRALLIATSVLLCFLSGSVHAQNGSGEIYIPETGHWIRGVYLQAYQNADDPILIFGYPITDEIIDPIDGQSTQYFEKARFDLVTDSAEPEIEIAALGDLLYTPGNEEVPISANAQACRYFSATGKYVCYTFLDFYDAHDGDTYFGNPISEVESVDGRYVQYFEKCRMEWRPELPAGNRVALSNIGEEYFDSRLGDFAVLNPSGNDNAPAELVKLQAHAFVANSLQPANSHQELFIIVQDQNLNPVNGANINVRITQPDGQVDVYRPSVSNSSGISTLKFEVGDMDINQVIQVQVEVDYKGFSAAASTWFRIWW